MSTIKTTQVLLSKVAVEQLKSLLQLLQEAVLGKALPENQNINNQSAQEISKKRVLGQISGGAENLPHGKKVRKLDPETSKRKQLSLSDLPWDTINIIINFS